MYYLSGILIFAYLSYLVYLTIVRPTKQSAILTTNPPLKPGVYLYTSARIEGFVSQVLEHSIIITTAKGLKVELLKTTITRIIHET